MSLSSLSRDELNERAAELGVEDPDSLPNKDAVIDAILEKDPDADAQSSSDPGDEPSDGAPADGPTDGLASDEEPTRKLSDVDVDALAEKWGRRSDEGGWGDEENAVYESLSPGDQAKLVEQLEKHQD